MLSAHGVETRPFRAAEDDWAKLCAQYLPHESEGSLWRSSHAVMDMVPDQGWKIHVTATIVTASNVLKAVGHFLASNDACFKGPRTLGDLRKLNCGLFFGYTQIGKFLTIYPKDDEEACRIAKALDEATREFVGPAVPYERRISPGSNVYTRYGAFKSRPIDGNAGGPNAVLKPDGSLTPDNRMVNPDWAVLPRGLVSLNLPDVRTAGLLKTRFRAYEPISQRGKGGVYRAIDLADIPARACILKEGRAAGESDWDGSDGRSRLTREHEVLIALADTVAVPAIHAFFEDGPNLYLALEFIEGNPLAAVLSPEQPLLDLAPMLELAIAAAGLLEAIHSKGWVWRDLKPSNLIVDASGKLRPIDFEGAERTQTVGALPWGSLGYISPEWLTAPTVDPTQDCYALGVLLHQLLTNRIPTSSGPLVAVTTVRSDVPPPICRLIEDLTDAEPAKRPSAAAALDCLGGLAHRLPTVGAVDRSLEPVP